MSLGPDVKILKLKGYKKFSETLSHSREDKTLPKQLETGSACCKNNAQYGIIITPLVTPIVNSIHCQADTPGLLVPSFHCVYPRRLLAIFS